jgi:glycerol-3-phosphate responsive antiterminator
MTGNGATLPPVLLPVRDRLTRAPRADEGLLFHDLALTDLIRLSSAVELPQAVDLDSVEGMAADAAALAFLVGRLGIRIIVSRRPALIRRAAELGCVPLLHVHCLDSTGLERALQGHPGRPVGTALSPGLILAHLPAWQRQTLPQPVLAYGLLRRPEEVAAAVEAGAAAVVLSPAPSLDRPPRRLYNARLES